jgi:putative glycosyltransferase (TIGR04372 family)
MKDKYLTNGEHVCFINRESAYLRVQGLEDGNYHDFRDFDFANYEKACLYLSNLRIIPIRIGKGVEDKKYDFDYLDLSGESIHDDIEIAAIGTSKFFVSGNSGIVHVAGLFRVPVLALNYIPLRVSDFFSLPKNSLIIPKLMFDTLNQRYLSLTEMIDVSQAFDIHYKGNFFEDNKIDVIENSVVDILNGVVEMNTNADLLGVSSVRKLDYFEEKLLDFVPGLEPLFREHNIRFSLRFLQGNGSILFPPC